MYIDVGTLVLGLTIAIIAIQVWRLNKIMGKIDIDLFEVEKFLSSNKFVVENDDELSQEDIDKIMETEDEEIS